jgi:hypothetical protein
MTPIGDLEEDMLALNDTVKIINPDSSFHSRKGRISDFVHGWVEVRILDWDNMYSDDNRVLFQFHEVQWVRDL